MKPGADTSARAQLLDQRIGKLGAELLLRAALFAGTMAVLAGMLAAIAGSSL